MSKLIRVTPLKNISVRTRMRKHWKNHGAALDWRSDLLTPETRYMKNAWWHSHEDNVHHRDLGEWTRNNMMLYPPRKDGEPARPFEIYWGRANVPAGRKGDQLKRVCFSLNNMAITQALTYTYNLRNREGYIMYEILKEAQDYAAKEVEIPDNMHIAECFSIEFKTEFMPLAATIAKRNISNCYVLLREGPPAENRNLLTTEDAIDHYINLHRNRVDHNLW